MPGGTWTQQNKVLPGFYLRFRSAASAGLTVGERGAATICEPLSWGPVAQVMEVAPGADMRKFTGYDITAPQNLFLREIFKGSNRTGGPSVLYLYRPTASGSAQAAATIGGLTVTARYPGVRGNDIAVSVTELTDPEGSFQVSTIVGGEIQDQQTAAEVSGLQANDWVTFSGTGALTANTGVSLEGGADGTVESAAYPAYLQTMEAYKFDVMIYDGTDTTVQTALISFIKRLASDSGRYAQLVASGLQRPDSQFVINIGNGVVLSDGTVLTAAQATWWAGGAEAGAGYSEALTFASYPGAVQASPKLTDAQQIAAVQAGQLTFFDEDGQAQVMQDINSLVTYTPETGRVFRKNRVMRLCSTIANDLYTQFARTFLGVVNNNAAGRSRFKAAAVGYFLDLQAEEAIQNFFPDDLEVLPGAEPDAIVVNAAISVVDSTEKIYMTVEVS